MNSKERTSKFLVFSVVLGDLLWMNALFAVLYAVWPHFHVGNVFSGSYWEMMLFNSICYVISTYHDGVVLHHRKKRNIHIVGKVTKNCLKFIAISVALLTLMGYEGLSTRFLILFHALNFSCWWLGGCAAIIW